MGRVEIKPAGIAQVHRSLRTGKRVLIADDVQNVARDLHEIDPSLKLEYDSSDEGFFVVLQTIEKPDGSSEDKLVTTATELDQRLVARIREIAHPGYDYAAELERLDRAAERRREHIFAEKVGPAAEMLQHALRKDLGVKPRVFVPKAVERG